MTSSSSEEFDGSFSQNSPEYNFPESEDGPVGPEQPSQVRRKKLRCKTSAEADHGYTKRPLLKVHEFKVQMHKKKVAKLTQSVEFRTARRNAIELLAMQLPTGAFEGEEEIESGPIHNPHPSHRIMALQGISVRYTARTVAAGRFAPS